MDLAINPILVFGANGQIGSAISRILDQCALTPSQEEIDFLYPEHIASQLEHYQPQAIINAAAYTAVDKCEEEESLAELINAEAPRVLAAYAASHNIPFIHFSTDYVFSGQQQDPYREDDQTAPINAYGRTKLNGDNAVIEIGGQYLIFRTSWVFSELQNNFVNTMLRMGKEKEVISVVSDQIGSPSYAADIAQFTLHALDKATQMDMFPSGVYHLCNSGVTSWYDFAEHIFAKASDLNTPLEVREVKPISSHEFPSAAMRPQNSQLNTEKFSRVFGLSLPVWEDALYRCLTSKLPSVEENVA